MRGGSDLPRAVIPPQPPTGALRRQLELQLAELDEAIARAPWWDRWRLRRERSCVAHQLATGEVRGAVH